MCACPKKMGALGVRNLGLFNKALMGKWVWRFLCDKNSLWAKVIYLLYADIALGEDGIVEFSRESNWSSWWRDVVCLGRGGEGK